MTNSEACQADRVTKNSVMAADLTWAPDEANLSVGAVRIVAAMDPRGELSPHYQGYHGTTVPDLQKPRSYYIHALKSTVGTKKMRERKKTRKQA